jgi:hypothetical protein
MQAEFCDGRAIRFKNKALATRNGHHAVGSPARISFQVVMERTVLGYCARESLSIVPLPPAGFCSSWRANGDGQAGDSCQESRSSLGFRK